MKLLSGIFIGVAAVVLILVSVIWLSPKSVGGGFSRLNLFEKDVISATFTATTGTTIGVSSADMIAYSINNVSTSGTVKFPCSPQDSAPNFSAAPSLTNRWSYSSVVDLESGSTIAGNTGIVFANSTTVRHVAIQNNVWKHCTALFTPSTGSVGSTTVKMLTISDN